MERFVQVMLVAVDEDISKGLPELNKTIAEMQHSSHEIVEVKPFGTSGRVWQVTYMKDNRGTENARGSIEEATPTSPEAMGSDVQES